MIVVFRFWREELKTLLAGLEEQCSEFQLAKLRLFDFEDLDAPIEADDNLNFRLERSLFYSALAIRKLLEADRLARNSAPDMRGEPLRALSNKARSACWSFRTDGGHSEQLNAKALADEIIHSSTISWLEEPGEKEFHGFWLASDRNAKRRELFVDWKQYFAVIRTFIAR